MQRTALQRIVLAFISATLCGVAFSLAYAQTLPPMSPASLQDGLRAVQTGEPLEALKHFQVLAAQGEAVAQYNLGLMYSHGLGVPADGAQAQYWLKQSASQGYPKAKLALERLP